MRTPAVLVSAYVKWSFVAVIAVVAAIFLLGDAIPVESNRSASVEVIQSQDRADKALGMVIAIVGVVMTTVCWGVFRRSVPARRSALVTALWIGVICAVIELIVWGIAAAFRPIVFPVVFLLSWVALMVGFVVVLPPSSNVKME